MKGATLAAARAAKAQVHALLSKYGDVVGVGLVSHDGGYAVKVNLASKPAKSLPTELGEVPIRVEVVGRISKR